MALAPSTISTIRRNLAEPLLIVALATGLRFMFLPWLQDKAPYAVFFPCVALCAWRGGFFAGLVATVAASILGLQLFVRPFVGHAKDQTAWMIGVAAFLLSAIIISFLGESNRRAKLNADSTLAELTDQRELLESALRVARLGVWHFREDLKHIYWDDRCAEILETTDLMGDLYQLMGLVHPSDIARLQADWRTQLRSTDGAVIKLNFRIVTSSGATKHLSIRGNVTGPRGGNGRQIVGSLLDNSEVMSAQAELAHLNVELELRVAERTAELQRKNEELQGFTYSVSHDMRTPLRGIVSNARIVMEEESDRLSESGRSGLVRLTAAAMKMSNLVDDLLEYARISRKEAKREVVDLTSMAREVADEVCGETGAVFSIAEDLVDDCDPSLAVLILHNLFDNACKYCPPMSAPRISLYQTERDGTRYFVVEDQGIGFSPEFSERIFRPFERLHRDDEYPGTGIGLANVKRAVERHGGSVWAESTPGNGASFFFSLH